MKLQPATARCDENGSQCFGKVGKRRAETCRRIAAFVLEGAQPLTLLCPCKDYGATIWVRAARCRGAFAGTVWRRETHWSVAIPEVALRSRFSTSAARATVMV